MPKILDQQATTRVSVVFYVKDGDNSPYQGMLQFSPEEYAALKPGELEQKQLDQFTQWQENTKALQAAQEANADAVPDQVTSAQARAAILAAGLKEKVEAVVAKADEATQALWYTAAIVERQNPVLLALAGILGLDDAQLDDLFRQAAQL